MDCVYVFVRVKISEKRVGEGRVVQRRGARRPKGKTVVPRDLKRGARHGSNDKAIMTKKHARQQKRCLYTLECE
jgi:hypothetical protein